jgi:PadR family transcriptional regulator, regulatory protein PadR
LNRDEIPPGTPYLLILKTLALHGELHGYEIAIRDPALQRMLIKGWVTAEWGVTAGNRRARYYKLMAKGSKQLPVEGLQFERVMGAIARVIQAA